MDVAVDCRALGFGGGEVTCTASCTASTENCCAAAGKPCTAGADCCSGSCIFDMNQQAMLCTPG